MNIIIPLGGKGERFQKEGYKEPKPLKLLIRDSLLVYVSVIIGGFILTQLTPVINDSIIPASPLAFTYNPPF